MQYRPIYSSFQQFLLGRVAGGCCGFIFLALVCGKASAAADVTVIVQQVNSLKEKHKNVQISKIEDVNAAAVKAVSCTTDGVASTQAASFVPAGSNMLAALKASDTNNVAQKYMTDQAKALKDIAVEARATALEAAQKAATLKTDPNLNLTPSEQKAISDMSARRAVNPDSVSPGEVQSYARVYSDYNKLAQQATGSTIQTIQQVNQVRGLASTDLTNGTNMSSVGNASALAPLGAAGLSAMNGNAGSGSASSMSGPSAGDGASKVATGDVSKSLGNGIPAGVVNNLPIGQFPTNNGLGAQGNQFAANAGDKGFSFPLNTSAKEGVPGGDTGFAGKNGVGRVAVNSPVAKGGDTSGASRMINSAASGMGNGKSSAAGADASANGFAVDASGGGLNSGAGVGLKDPVDPLAAKEGIKLAGNETDAEIAKLMEQMKGDFGMNGNLSPEQQAQLVALQRDHPELAQQLAASGLSPTEQLERLKSLGDATKPLFNRVRETMVRYIKGGKLTSKNRLSVI